MISVTADGVAVQMMDADEFKILRVKARCFDVLTTGLLELRESNPIPGARDLLDVIEAAYLAAEAEMDA